MSRSAFAFFDTAIGRCGIAWGDNGVVAVQLPEADEERTRTRLIRRTPEAIRADPPAEIARAIDAITALVGGSPIDLNFIALDLDAVPPFHRRVYEVARSIPPGATLSYGEVADRLGDPGAARAVGQALGQNPFPIVIPCHRVLAARDKIGGFSGAGGAATKRRLLAIEAAATGRTLF